MLVEFFRSVRTAHFDRENTQWKFSVDVYNQVRLGRGRACSTRPSCLRMLSYALSGVGHAPPVDPSQVVTGLRAKRAYTVEEPPSEELDRLNLKSYGMT